MAMCDVKPQACQFNPDTAGHRLWHWKRHPSSTEHGASLTVLCAVVYKNFRAGKCWVTITRFTKSSKKELVKWCPVSTKRTGSNLASSIFASHKWRYNFKENCCIFLFKAMPDNANLSSIQHENRKNAHMRETFHHKATFGNTAPTRIINKVRLGG